MGPVVPRASCVVCATRQLRLCVASQHAAGHRDVYLERRKLAVFGLGCRTQTRNERHSRHERRLYDAKQKTNLTLSNRKSLRAPQPNFGSDAFPAEPEGRASQPPLVQLAMSLRDDAGSLGTFASALMSSTSGGSTIGSIIVRHWVWLQMALGGTFAAALDEHDKLLPVARRIIRPPLHRRGDRLD